MSPSKYWRFKTLAILVGIVGLLGVGLVACGDDDAAPVPAAAPSTKQAAPAAAKAPAAPAAKAVTPARTTKAPSGASPTIARFQPPTAAMYFPDPNAKVGGRLQMGCSTDLAHSDIIQSGSTSNVFPPFAWNANLLRFSIIDSVTVVPDLAESWEFSDDRKTLTLRLRPGLKYHDGTAFDTKDVYATYDRIINPPKGVASLRKAQFEVVESMEIVDPLTFKFHMSEPKGLMLGMLAMGWNVISSDEFLKEHDYNLRRVDNQPGVGPFKFRTHEQGEIWELDRFDGYWQQPLPYVDGIDCYEFSGQAAGPETTALITGQLDMAVSIAADVGVEILNGERPGLIHSYSVSPFTNGLFFNIAKGAPFDDVRVRYAIHLAINRQQNIEAISRMSSFILGTYIVSNSPYAPTYEELLTWPGYRPDKTEDLAEAKRLMAEAGYPDGFKTRYLSGTGTTNSITSAVYQDNLKDLGIEVEIDLVEGVQYFEEVREGKFHMAKGGVGYTIDDPEDALVTIAHPDAPSNYSRYSNPEVTGLLRELSGAFGFDERKRIGDEILVILEREQPIAMFAYNSRHFPYWDYVHGFPFIGANLYSTARWDSIWLDRPH